MALNKLSHDAKNAVEVTNLLPSSGAHKGTMGISSDGARFLAHLLTDLYSDPVLATVRELISNGQDAVRLLPEGSTGKVYVDLPTSLSQQFVVRDEGVGMTREELLSAYVNFLGSTKRDNFDQIGAYGLGAKAPLSYATSFVVRTVKNGMATVLTLSRETEGNGYEILSHTPTEEASGTTVTVPVLAQDMAKFYKALEGYKHLPGTVEVISGGKPLATADEWLHWGEVVLDEDTGLTGRVFLRKDMHVTRTLLLKNSAFCARDLAYVLEGYLYPGGGYTRPGVIVELAPGVVDFTPSRDSIVANQRLTALQGRVLTSLRGEEEAQGLALLLSLPADQALSFYEMNAGFFAVAGDRVTIHMAATRGGDQLSEDLGAFDLPNGANYLRYRESKRALSYYASVAVASGSLQAFVEGEQVQHGVNEALRLLREVVLAGRAATPGDTSRLSHPVLHGGNTPTVFLEDTDTEVMRAYRRERISLKNTELRGGNLVFLAGRMPTAVREELALLQAMGSKDKVMSREEFLALTTKLQKANKRLAPARKRVEATVTVTLLTPSCPAPEDLLTGTYSTDATLTIPASELLKGENTLLLFHNFSRPSRLRDGDRHLSVLRGLANGGVPLEGRRIVAFNPSHLDPTTARKLGATPRSYGFLEYPSYSLQLPHKWVKERVEATPRPSPVLVSAVEQEQVDDYVAAGLFARGIYSRGKVLSPVLVAMGAHVRDEALRKLLGDLRPGPVPASSMPSHTIEQLLIAHRGKAYAEAFANLQDYISYGSHTRYDVILREILEQDVPPEVDSAQLAATLAPLLEARVEAHALRQPQAAEAEAAA